MKHKEKVRISRLSLGNIIALHRLFIGAVSNNFGYFPDSYQIQIVRQHSPLRLFIAYLRPARILLTAKDSNQNLVGYAIGRAFSGGTGQIYWLYVDPKFRGRNTGLSLLAQMLRRQESHGSIEVTLATHDYRRYYERQGFAHHSVMHSGGVPMDLMIYHIQKP